MFGRKKLPVLTDTFCDEINLIMKIAAVTTGTEWQIKRYDFNTGRGQVQNKNSVREFYFQDTRDDLKNFAFISREVYTEDSPEHYMAYTWYVVRIDGESLRVGEKYGRDPNFRRGTMPMWWVGTSSSDRRTEAYFK